LTAIDHSPNWGRAADAPGRRQGDSTPDLSITKKLVDETGQKPFC
jgi:hypothetical protein